MMYMWLCWICISVLKMWLGRTPLSILATLARASRSCAQPTKSPIQAAWSRAKHTDARFMLMHSHRLNALCADVCDSLDCLG